jgi:two-component system, LuxR family, sensor kinase FixL
MGINTDADLRLAEEQARASSERMMQVARVATADAMATGIAHELNQPLAAITTYAQAAARLLRTSPAELQDVAEALEQISAQALRAGAIIRRMRELVRSGDTQREPTQINSLIEELSTPTRSDARKNDVRITLDLAPDLPLAPTDTIQIRQVLLNLVRNAVQALEGSSSIDRQIAISTSHGSDGNIEVRVQDNGPGVSQDVLGKLFMPFVTTKTNSIGLGLAISRSIIEAHQGKLEYTHSSPHGACFAFHLPALKQTSV